MIIPAATVPEEQTFSPIEPTPLPWPRLRDVRADGRGRALARAALRSRGTRRAAVIRDLAFRLAGNFTPSLAVEADGIRYHLNTADKEISRIVFIYGLYDRPLMHAAFAALSAAGGRTDFAGRKLLDVGANIGTTTLTACTHFGASGAHAFEPDPTNAEFLRMNLTANRLEDRVTLRRAAVSDRAATLRLLRSSTNAGDHRVVDEVEASSDLVVEVPSVTVDDLVTSGELDLGEIGAAWVDVQGHEGRALAGARRLLDSDVPLVVEYWPFGLDQVGDFDLFNSIVAEHRNRIVDLGGPAGVPDFTPLPATELTRVAERYAGEDDHTDILVLPREMGE